MKKIMLSFAMLIISAVAHSSEAPVKPERVLISGTEETKSYVKELEVRGKGDATHTDMNPSTYTLRNGIYLLPDGSCVEYKSELVEIERTGNANGYIEAPVIRNFTSTVTCPSERG